MRRKRLVVAIGVSAAVAAAAIVGARGHEGPTLRAEPAESSAAPAAEHNRDADSDRDRAKAPSYSSLSPTVSQPVVISAARHDTSPALRSIPPLAVKGVLHEGPENPARAVSPGAPAQADPVVQAAAPSAPMPSLLASFDGVPNVDGVLPPDTNGDVGPTQYVQIVNVSFAVFSKSGSTLYGPANINTLFTGFGGPCQTTDDGDPIVQYDQLADRWLITQFALPNYPNGPFYQCIAVSTTGNATGSWYRYQFQISSAAANLLNDYPKFGVWPDAYYASFNDFRAGAAFTGVTTVAFERAQLLAGGAARAVMFVLGTAFYSMLPSDLDGSALPPAGAPDYFVQMDDNAWGYPQDQLEIWKFHVDWATPANSTFTADPVLATAAFDSNLAGIQQPGTGVRLDTLSDRLMYRLAYRNFGSYQAMVVTHSVDSNGADRGGIRWYELRKSGGAFAINQQGTYAPSSTNRWMGSVAMDQNGDIALGYSAGSSTVFPSIYYAGRVPSDPAGTLSMESTLLGGSGSQTHSAARWGDYSAITVDPTDDCTFWYTNEYLQVTGSAPWRTRVGSFRFPGCGSSGPPATIQLRSVSSASNNAAAALVVPKPAGVASGDVLLAQVTYNSTGTITAPAGWSQVRSDVNASYLRQSAFVHVAGAGEPGSYTWTLAAAHGAVGAILAYTGVDTSNPVDVSSGGAGHSRSVTAPSLNAAAAGEQLVGLFGAKGPVTFTPPAGMSEQSEVSFTTVSGEKLADESADAALAAPGATGNRSATASATVFGIGQLIALRPGTGSTQNQPPVVDSVTIDQTSPVTNDVLTATIASHDPDGNPVTYAYQWSRNGVNIAGGTGSTLDLSAPGNGNKGDAIALRVVASDGSLQSAPVTSAPVTIVDAPPTATVGLSPTSPTTTDVLTATAAAADLDGDAVTLTYVWTVNGVVRQTTAGTSSLTDTFDLGPSGNGDPGDVVSVSVTPNDGTVDGTAASASVTVAGSGSGVIVLRSVSSASNNAAAALVVPKPAGVASGDVLLAQVTYNSTGTITAPAGWSQVRSDVNASYLRQSAFVHVAGAGEPGSYTWTLAAAHGAVGAILAYTGVDTSNPVDVSSGGAGHSRSVTAPSLNAAAAGEQLVGLFGAKGPVTFTPPAGMSEQSEVSFTTVSGEKLADESADAALAAPGATGNRSATASATVFGIGQLIALRPGP